MVISNYISLKVSTLLAHPSGQLALETLKKQFTKKNPDYVEAKKWGRSVYNIEQYIFTHHILGDELKIARGGVRKVEDHLTRFRIPVEWVDYTQVCEPVTIFRKAKYPLREDQRQLIDSLYKEFKKMPVPQGLALANTSFGKTFTMIYMMNEIGQPALILVHTTFLQKQWIEELTMNFGVNKKDIGGAGGVFAGKPKIGKINVALYHSMSKKEINILFRDKVGLLLVDEGQKAVIAQFQDAIKDFRARYRLSVTANHERKDGKTFVVTDTIGEVLYQAEETESNSKIFSKIYGTVTRWRPSEEGFTSILSEAGRNEDRNIRIAKSAVRKVKEGKIVIIFVERKEQAGALAKILSKFRVHLLVGKVPPKEIALMDIPQKAKDFLTRNDDPEKALDEVKELALARDLDIIIATQKGEVGLSIETLDHAIVTTPVGNNLERFNQLKGRVERKHKGIILEKFGEKAVPTVEVMVDEWDTSYNSWASIRNEYKEHIIKNPYLITKG